MESQYSTPAIARVAVAGCTFDRLTLFTTIPPSEWQMKMSGRSEAPSIYDDTPPL